MYNVLKYCSTLYIFHAEVLALEKIMTNMNYIFTLSATMNLSQPLFQN